jgi:hypothetical protein
VRVGFLRDRIRILAHRRPPPRETRHRQIERTPEKMHRTAFADKARPELLQYPIDVGQNSMERFDMLSLIRSVMAILIEWGHIVELTRHAIQPDLDT